MSLLSKAKSLIKENEKIRNILVPLYNFFGFNQRKIRGKGNSIITKGFLRKTKIEVLGNNNTVIFDSASRVENSKIFVSGSGNLIHIGKHTFSNEVTYHIEDDGGKISIGQRSGLCGKAMIASIEGKSITVGEDCLFSSDITIRTGDSHSILDMDGKRINPSLDVFISDRVWLGNHVILTKGAKIASDSVVATGAVVTKKFDESFVILGGVPAKIIKENIKWDKQRI